MNTGVQSIGIKAPLIKEGDDIVSIVVDSVIETVREQLDGDVWDFGPKVKYNLNDDDIIGITESAIARATGNYVTVDEIANETKRIFGENSNIVLLNPIYSRNRFSIILKGIARGANSLHIVMPKYDEVGNPNTVNPFTGVNITEYYKAICEQENCKVEISENLYYNQSLTKVLDCSLRPKLGGVNLTKFFPDKCEWGLLGSNLASEEKLKLFPNKKVAQKICEDIQTEIKNITGKHCIVCSYGDGAFKDPVGGIWEFADPVTMPAYTDADIMESSPHELKLKYLIDSESGEDFIEAAIKISTVCTCNEPMMSQGTTPRVYRDLLASLMDLTSGSGDKGTPIVLVKDYFNKYTD